YIPAWSKGGTKLLFTSFRDGNAEIYLMDAEGGNERNLTNNPALDISGLWKPATEAGGQSGGNLLSLMSVLTTDFFTPSASIFGTGAPLHRTSVLIRTTGEPEGKTFINISQAESTVKVVNGNPGLRNLEITVNGTVFRVAGLGDNEVRRVDVSSAMLPGGNNTITMEAHGRPESKAWVVITD
ncbi:MAG: hypothetical protein M3430_10600, partial [Acidobacteriota bacterium]|nr:hypothetical protein [Acidobacteriota bacterium]